MHSFYISKYTRFVMEFLECMIDLSVYHKMINHLLLYIKWIDFLVYVTLIDVFQHESKTKFLFSQSGIYTLRKNFTMIWTLCIHWAFGVFTYSYRKITTLSRKCRQGTWLALPTPLLWLSRSSEHDCKSMKWQSTSVRSLTNCFLYCMESSTEWSLDIAVDV